MNFSTRSSVSGGSGGQARPQGFVRRAGLAAARFAAEELRPFADDWDARGEFPAECFRKAAGEGLAGLFAPAAVGGQGLDTLTACMVYEALARGCFATTFGLVVHNNVVRALALAGTPAARDRWLGSLVNGELLGSFALTEPDAGSDAAAIATRACPTCSTPGSRTSTDAEPVEVERHLAVDVRQRP